MRPPQTKEEAERRWCSGEGSRFRKSLDRTHCTRCGATNRPLHCNHNEPRKDAPERTFHITNIEILCHLCHAIEHGQL